MGPFCWQKPVKFSAKAFNFLSEVGRSVRIEIGCTCEAHSVSYVYFNKYIEIDNIHDISITKDGCKWYTGYNQTFLSPKNVFQDEYYTFNSRKNLVLSLSPRVRVEESKEHFNTSKSKKQIANLGVRLGAKLEQIKHTFGSMSGRDIWKNPKKCIYTYWSLCCL